MVSSATSFRNFVPLAAIIAKCILVNNIRNNFEPFCLYLFSETIRRNLARWRYILFSPSYCIAPGCENSFHSHPVTWLSFVARKGFGVATIARQFSLGFAILRFFLCFQQEGKGSPYYPSVWGSILSFKGRTLSIYVSTTDIPLRRFRLQERHHK